MKHSRLSRREKKDREKEEAARVLRENLQIEHILFDGEGGYMDLVENSDSLMQSCTPGGVIYYVNKKWLDTLGYTAEDVTERYVFDYIHPNYHTECMATLKRITDKSSIEMKSFAFVSKEGKPIRVEGRVSCRFEDGEPVATRGFFSGYSSEVNP